MRICPLGCLAASWLIIIDSVTAPLKEAFVVVHELQPSIFS